ncbi:hypothetical protein Tco_1299391 [Tanacetum coccineum]
MKSVLAQYALDALCEKFYISDAVHPELPGPNSRIRNSPIGISRYYTLDEGCYLTFWDDKDEGGDGLVYVHPSCGSYEGQDRGEGEGAAAEGVGNENVDEGSGGGTTVADQAEQSGPTVRIGSIDIETIDGASGSGYPPKRLRKDHDTSGDAGASKIKKSLAALQDLLDKSTIAAEIGATAADTVPFVTSYVTPTPEHEGRAYTDSVSAANVQTKRPVERFVISLDTPHDSNANVADDEVSSVVRSSVPDPAVLTMTVATTVVAGTSVPPPKEVNEPTRANIFADSTSAGNDVLNESALDESNVCRSLVDQLAPPTFFAQLRAMDYDRLFTEFNVGAAHQTCLEMADLKAWLSLNEAKAAEATRLRGQIANVKAAKATKDGELNSLREQNVVLESATVAKDSEIAKLSQELSSLQLSSDCFGLRDEVLGYKLFKERIEEMQDEEFYPRFLTTIAGRRWILSRGVKLAVVKCLQSPEYMAAMGKAIGRAIDKGMQDGLVVGIEHGKVGRSPDEISANNPFAEDNYVAAINAIHTVEFPLLAQLESLKDASMTNIIDLICLEGPTAEAPETSQLQPSLKQLMVPIHQLEDQAIIGETSLSFSLEVTHNRVQRFRGDAAGRHLSLTDVIVPLVEPLSTKSLVGEASTFGIPTTTTALSTTFIQVCTVPPAPSTDAPLSPKIVFEQEELDTTPEHTSAP